MKAFVIVCLFLASSMAQAQTTFTRADSLRGGLNAERSWWNVLRYDIEVEPDFRNRSIQGQVSLLFRATRAESLMQIDLQQPMKLNAVALERVDGWRPLPFIQYADSNIVRITFPGCEAGSNYRIRMSFSGVPKAAVHPPWDGGWIWKTDEGGNPWISAAVQGLGASAWFPCKDHPSDEPDFGASLSVHVPEGIQVVSNGRLIQKINDTSSGKMRFTWEVKNPINLYNIVPYIGNYVQRRDTFCGESGVLNIDYYFLAQNAEKAEQQFQQTKKMLRSMEYWFGPYPFYEDGYKLVEAPHLGMEHQSAIAYGNGFQNGYLGRDLSGSGEGMKFDFIIVHESGHEWFGNNISAGDVADMWIHESFTSFSEVLYLDYHYGKQSGNRYCVGVRKNIENKKPMVGAYSVQNAPGPDIYYKGENMLQTLRHSVGNDDLFRAMLRGLNRQFYHQTVTTSQIENYISSQLGTNYTTFFNQYLRSVKIPVLEFYRRHKKLYYRYVNCVPGFYLPIHFSAGGAAITLQPAESWQQMPLPEKFKSGAFVSELEDQYYILVKEVKSN